MKSLCAFFFSFCILDLLCLTLSMYLIYLIGKAVVSLEEPQFTEEWHGLSYSNLIFPFTFYFLCTFFFPRKIIMHVEFFNFRHHQHGRWQARIGRVAGNKDLYLGTFSEFLILFHAIMDIKYLVWNLLYCQWQESIVSSFLFFYSLAVWMLIKTTFIWSKTGTQEEAAEAYDIAAIKFRGLNAVTNFDMNRYDVKSIANSNLPIGGISGGKSKNSSESASDSRSIEGSRSDDRDLSSASSVTFASQPATSTLSFAIPIKQDPSDYWTSILGYQNTSAKNTSSGIVAPSTLYQSSTSSPPFQSPTAFSMDFNANSSVNDNSNNNNNNGLLFNGGYIQQQQSVGNGIISTSSSSTSNIPFATPIAALHGNNGSGSYDGNSSYGSSWIAQSLHSYQSAKPNLSVFQTPIFGMEWAHQKKCKGMRICASMKANG